MGQTQSDQTTEIDPAQEDAAEVPQDDIARLEEALEKLEKSTKSALQQVIECGRSEVERITQESERTKATLLDMVERGRSEVARLTALVEEQRGRQIVYYVPKDSYHLEILYKKAVEVPTAGDKWFGIYKRSPDTFFSSNGCSPMILALLGEEGLAVERINRVVNEPKKHEGKMRRVLKAYHDDELILSEDVPGGHLLYRGSLLYSASVFFYEHSLPKFPPWKNYEAFETEGGPVGIRVDSQLVHI